MAIEKTLSIIKPDAVAKNVIGKIIARFEENGFNLMMKKPLASTQSMMENLFLMI